MPLVSVLIPVYNAESTLPHALESIRRQTLTDWECLLVDDGSTDGSAALCERCQALDPRFRLLRRPREGIVGALNAGLDAAAGKLLARMDADDLSHRDRLRQQVELLAARPDLDLVGCRVRCFPRTQVLAGMRHYEGWLNSLVEPEELRRDMFVESPFAHPSVMARTHVLRDAGGYQDHGWPEDYDLWLRLYVRGCRFAKVPKTLLYWREHPARLSRTHAAYSLRAFRRAKVHYLRQSFLKGQTRVQIWGAGRGGRLWGTELQQAGISLDRYLDIDPRKIGGSLRRAPVVAFQALETDRRPFPILVCVGGWTARYEIRRELDRMGYRETVDYLCVA